MVTYLMAISVPRLDLMIPLVGVTSGTLCALVYPPLFHTITFWSDWKLLPTGQRRFRIAVNVIVMCIGFLAIGAGIYANGLQIYRFFAGSLPVS